MIINPKQLRSFRALFKDRKIVFCSGTWDFLHPGQIGFLREAKTLGDMLFVSVGLDSVIKRNKGPKRPILNQDLRLQSIDALVVVDICFLDDDPVDEHPLATLKTNLENLKPDIYAVNYDAFDLDYRQALVKGTRTRLEILNVKTWFGGPDEPIVSTTEIIKRIKAL